MEFFWQQVLSGIASGCIYAILALALVMIYKASKEANFALGEMSMLSTYIAWWLINLEFGYWIAFFITIFISFFLGMLLERLTYRPFEKRSHLVHLIIFVGLLLAINGIAGWLFGYDLKVFPSPFPETIQGIRNVYLGGHEIGVIFTAFIVMILMKALFQYTKLGLALRASADNPISSRLVGIRVGWMMAIGWGLATSIGAIAGMMAAPKLFLDPSMMSSVLLYAFAAAVFGGLTSPIGVIVGGFAIGIFENLGGAYIPFIGHELKLPFALFIILIVLILKPEGLFGKPSLRRV